MKSAMRKIPARFSAPLVLLFLSAFSVAAQSTDQNFPTPVATNEISGTIRARDVGDARLTSYFFAFNGNQGDVFINVVTNNLNGDIDVFTADGLRPLTKIAVYAGAQESETGRVVYLRQPQRLILRVEGRTPDDNPAVFRIKFAGTFAPATGVAESEQPKLPDVKRDEQSDVRVNSVGTIIEVKPKPTPAPKETVAKNENVERRRTQSPPRRERNRDTKNEDDPKETRNETSKPIATENAAPENEPETAETAAEPSVNSVAEKKTEEPAARENDAGDESEKTGETPPARKPTPAPENKTAAKTQPKRPQAVDPSLLENVRLIVLFKDGAKVERAMSEILRVGVDKGILTIIFKNGSIARYSILDVAKMTIE